jgi:hypothetical protein
MSCAVKVNVLVAACTGITYLPEYGSETNGEPSMSMIIGLPIAETITPVTKPQSKVAWYSCSSALSLSPGKGGELVTRHWPEPSGQALGLIVVSTIGALRGVAPAAAKAGLVMSKVGLAAGKVGLAAGKVGLATSKVRLVTGKSVLATGKALLVTGKGGLAAGKSVLVTGSMFLA